MARFVLVPGAWHDAWAYHLLAAELERRGHRAIAVELPIEDVGAGLADYADTVEAVIDEAGGDGELVVVGHSFAGLTIPLVADRRPVDRLVFLAALVPRPGVSANQEFADGHFWLTEAGRGGRDTDAEGRTLWTDADHAIACLYQDCDPQLAAEAVTRLRPQAQRASADPCPLAEWPAAPSSYISCTDDRMFGDLGPSLAADRLGVEPIELPGGHSPMLSRPAELANVLGDLARW